MWSVVQSRPCSAPHTEAGVSLLRTTMSAPDFEFPRIHDFAPFYTLQPNPETAATQVEMWARLVLSYCRAHKRFVLQAGGEWERTSELFCHRTIDRALSPDMVRVLFAYLVQQGRAAYDPPLPKGVKPLRVGQVEADHRMHALSVAGAEAVPAGTSEPGSKIWVYWHTPSEWGDVLYEWIKNTGQNRSVLTVYELQHSAFAEQHALPLPILMLALRSLAARGCAQLFGGTEAAGEEEQLGVKFV